MELAPNLVIVIVLGLIVLAIAAVLIYQYSTKSAKQYTAYTAETEPSKLKECESFIFGRHCVVGSCPAKEELASQYKCKDLSQTCCEPA